MTPGVVGALTLLTAPDDGGDESATEVVRESAESISETTLDALPRVGIALGIIVFGWILSRVLRFVLQRVFARTQTPSFSQVMSKVFGYVLLFLFVLIAIAVTFPSVKPVDLLAGLGFFSVAIGFAFQDILENTLSGILLLFRQPFESGDEIEVGEHQGRVERITIRETRLRTFAGELIVIPNRDVYKGAIAAVKRALDEHDIEMPADIIALQATPSLRAALHDDGEITPGGSVRA